MYYQNAPQLYHNAGKGKGIFYKLPQEIMDVVFRELDGKNGNALKLMTVLMGTAGDGRFRISAEWIRQRTGMSKSNYHRTKKALQEMGFLFVEDGKIIVNIKGILEKGSNVESDSLKEIDGSHHHEEQCYHHEEERSQHDDLSSSRHDDYNRKQINNYIKDNIKENDSISSNEEEVAVLFKRMGIDFSNNTKKEIEKTIGEKIDYEVLSELILANKKTWDNFSKANKSQGYRYSAFKNILKSDYKKIKYNVNNRKQYMVTAVDSKVCSNNDFVKETTDGMNPNGNHSVVEIKVDLKKQPEPEKEQGLTDDELMEMLEDMFDETDSDSEPVEEEGKCASLLLLEELRKLKSEDDELFD